MGMVALGDLKKDKYVDRERDVDKDETDEGVVD